MVLIQHNRIKDLLNIFQECCNTLKWFSLKIKNFDNGNSDVRTVKIVKARFHENHVYQIVINVKIQR